MAKQEEGIVVAVEGNIAKVVIKRHSHCESCGNCPGNNALVLDTINKVGAKVNQRVICSVQEKNVLIAAFMVFLLPLITTTLGYWAATKLAFGYQITATWLLWAGSVSGFFLGVGIVIYYDKIVRSRSAIPVIVEAFDN